MGHVTIFGKPLPSHKSASTSLGPCLQATPFENLWSSRGPEEQEISRENQPRFLGICGKYMGSIWEISGISGIYINIHIYGIYGYIDIIEMISNNIIWIRLGYTLTNICSDIIW